MKSNPKRWPTQPHTTRVNSRRRRQSRFGRPEGHPKAAENRLRWLGCPSCRPLTAAQPRSPPFSTYNRPTTTNSPSAPRPATAPQPPTTARTRPPVACGHRAARLWDLPAAQATDSGSPGRWRREACFPPLAESLRPPTPRRSARPNEGEQLYETASGRFTTSMAGSDSQHGGSEGRLRQLENMRGEGSMPAEAQKRPKRSPDQTSLAAATGNRRTPPRGRTVDGAYKAGPLTEDQARWARRGATTG